MLDNLKLCCVVAGMGDSGKERATVVGMLKVSAPVSEPTRLVAPDKAPAGWLKLNKTLLREAARVVGISDRMLDAADDKTGQIPSGTEAGGGYCVCVSGAAIRKPNATLTATLAWK